MEIRDFNVVEADWHTRKRVLQEIRRLVFIVEQHVPQDEEWDGRDEDSWHWIATDASDVPIGTGRLLPDGQIGRMAVLNEHRGRGIGFAILEAAVDKARRLGMAEVFLHAQKHAIGFYEKAGFEPFGDEFDEAGIPHLAMRQTLGDEDRSAGNIADIVPKVALREYDVAETAWSGVAPMVHRLRQDVFVRELNGALPDDSEDAASVHFTATDDAGHVVGAARLQADGEISAIAVVQECRRRGIAHGLIESAVSRATRSGYGQLRLTLNAALASLAEACGFAPGTDGSWLRDVAIVDPRTETPRSKLDGERYSDDNVYRLGDTNRLILLRREEEFRNMVLAMSEQAIQTVRLYTRLLDHKLYDSEDLASLFSELARRNRYTSIQVLLYDPHRVVKNGHRLVELSRRLSSSINIRIVHPDYRQLNHEYLLADSTGVIYRLDYETYEGYANFKDITEANRLHREFNRAWDTSLTDPNLRQQRI